MHIAVNVKVLYSSCKGVWEMQTHRPTSTVQENQETETVKVKTLRFQLKGLPDAPALQ
jgi:hypothetical protein